MPNMTRSAYISSGQSRLVSPGKPDGPTHNKLMSSMVCPQTITLRDQSESILRGMAVSAQEQTAMQMTAKKEALFTQSAAQRQAPLLPSMGQLTTEQPSRPIRITRRTHHTEAPRPSQPGGEDMLSASPTELKMMYDEATWRMYHLIQTSRLEKQAARAATVPAQGNSNDKYLYDDSFFLQPGTPAPSDMHMPSVVSPDEPEDDGEEGVFELDDL